MQNINLVKNVILVVFTMVFYGSHGQDQQFTMNPIGSNNFLDKPWDLQLAPDGFLWVTERERGVVVRINPENAARDELIQIADHSSTAGQDGLLGLALHQDFAGDSAFVYLSYTYMNQGRRQKLVRYTYSIDGEDGTLSEPITLIDNLPSSDDHNSGRLLFGPDRKLYYTIGDQGGNQNRNYCNAVLSQVLPSQEEIDQQDWSNYPGKILRLNLDGSIPADNPALNGVVSHIYSYGHRNPQGIAFSVSGQLYSDEHGPDTDDEVNRINAGMNYGWPNVVGFKDDQAYDYCNWSSLSNCSSLDYSKSVCPTGATFSEENEFVEENYQEPLASMFAVTDDYDFNNPACQNSWICRPNVAPSSIGIYQSDAIPGWNNSLLVTSLKRGRIYRFQLNEDGTTVVGDTTQHFYTTNRYRDIVVHPDGKTFYVLTGQSGRTSDKSGLNIASSLSNPGNILKFTLNEVVSASQEEIQSPIKVWPNPATQQLHIVLEDSPDNYQGRLMSINGQVVKEFSFTHSVRITENIGHLTAGVYLLVVNNAKRTWQQRIVVQ